MRLTINYIFYSFLMGGFIWLVTACQGSQPKSASAPPATTTTGSATGGTTGTTAPPAKKQFLWTGNLEISNLKKYHDLLREQKRCGQCSVGNWGESNCKRFKAIANVAVTFEKEELPSPVTIKITPFKGSSFGFLNVGICGFTHPNPTAPLVYKGTAKYINDYSGFYARFHKGADFLGQAGLSYLILKSEYGLPIDRESLDITVYYGGSSKSNHEMGSAQLDIPGQESTYVGRGGIGR